VTIQRYRQLVAIYPRG